MCIDARAIVIKSTTRISGPWCRIELRCGFASASPSDLAAGARPDRSHASTLYRLPHGSLRSAEGTGERRFEDGSLMLDHYTRKAAQDHLDAAQKVDTTARAVDVAHPNGDALDGTRILPELFAESSPDVCPVLFIKSDPVDSDICGG